MTFVHILRKQNGESMIPEVRKQQGLKPLSAYFTAQYVQYSADWYKNLGNGEFTYTPFEVHTCSVDDFIEGENRQELFDSWAGFYMLCPTYKKDDGTQL